MSYIQGKNMTDLRRSNKSRVIETLLRYGPISRAEISNILDLTPASISTISRELIDKGLIEETGIQENENTAGRKRKNLDVIPNSKLAIGVEIGVKNIIAGIINLKGKLLNKITVDINDKRPEKIIDETENIIGIIKKRLYRL